MLWWLKRGLGLVLRFMFRFFFRSFTRAMGCFLACFRGRENRNLPKSQRASPEPGSTDVLISRSRSPSSFEYEEEKKDSARNDGVVTLGDYEGLKDQAKFLKACGTLARTPAEIQKASEKLKVSPSCGEDSELSKFHSWLPSTSVEKLQLDVEPFNSPTPIKHCQESEGGKDSFERTPTSCISNAQDTQHDSLDYIEGTVTGSLHTEDRTEKNAASVSPWPATDTQKKSKSVRFECDTYLSSCGSSSDDWHLKKSRSPNNQSTYKQSPYPTPLKLFDEMQTPGTVCPATLEELPGGKPRVRSQFVYPNYNQGENVFRCKILEDKAFNPEQDSSELSDSVEQEQNANSIPEKVLNKISHENEFSLEVSLSSCLKTASVHQEERNKIVETAYGQIPHFHKIADRPIIGVVAAHWNEGEVSHISSPKWRDGNGIPNSTKKYKEDQKVKWHATPFETRLEKALSEESFISERKLDCGQPVVFDDIEESDAALSELQSSSHARSVVSF